MEIIRLGVACHIAALLIDLGVFNDINQVFHQP